MTTYSRVFALILAAAALSGCSVSEPATANEAGARPDNRIQPQYDAAGKLQKLDYDRDGDGKPETWGYMDGTRIVRVESDENGDGAVDRWEFHRSAAADAGPAQGTGPDTTIERVERAAKFDGRVSRWEFFDAGVLARVEEDTDGNGKVDKWETYTAGALSVMALDTQGRGTPDRRLVYGPDGAFDRLEADSEGTGTFKRIDP